MKYPKRKDKYCCELLCDNFHEIDDRLINLADRIKQIIDAGAGESGATFTPHVSKDGVLSWSNDKNLTNPESVNLRGADGVGIRGITIEEE